MNKDTPPTSKPDGMRERIAWASRKALSSGWSRFALGQEWECSEKNLRYKGFGVWWVVREAGNWEKLCNYFFLFFLNYSHLRIFERGRERERKENIHMREKHQLIASRTHSSQGLNLQTFVCVLTRNQPATLWCTGRHSNQPSHTGMAGYECFLSELMSINNFWKCSAIISPSLTSLPFSPFFSRTLLDASQSSHHFYKLLFHVYTSVYMLL